MKKIVLMVFLIAVILLVPAAAEEKPIITVLDFTVDGVSELEMKSIINYLSSALFKTGKFTVIDVSQRENILKELEFSMSGCSDESCYLDIGKMLSAEGIVTGNIGRVGSRFLMTAKLLETETGATISAAEGMYKDLDALLDDIFAAADELGSPYGESAAAVTAEPETEAEPAEDKSLTAAEAAPDPEPEAEPEPIIEKEAAVADDETVAESEPSVTTVMPPVDINWPAWGSAAAGAGCLGTGMYFLITSLIQLDTFQKAETAYLAATDPAAAVTLYNDVEAARAASVDVNVNLPLGIGLTSAGVGLGVLAAILFMSEEPAQDPPVEIVFNPVPGGMLLGFNMSF